MTFLLCMARSSTQPRPNSRAATSQACPKSCEISSVRMEIFAVAMVFQIRLVDLGARFRRARLIGHGVQLDDDPAAELDVVNRREHTRNVDAASSQLDPAIRLRIVGLVGSRALDVLEVEEEMPPRVLADRGDRIAAALPVMRDVELELDVARIRRVEDSIDLLGFFSEVVHVIVITE